MAWLKQDLRSGIWYIRFYDETGREKNRSLRTRNEAEANEELARRKAIDAARKAGLEIAGIPGAAKKVVHLPCTFGQFVAKYEKWVLNPAETYKEPQTYYQHERPVLRAFVAYMGGEEKPLTDALNVETLVAFRGHTLKTRSLTTWDTRLRALKAIFNRAVAWKLLPVNPFKQTDAEGKPVVKRAPAHEVQPKNIELVTYDEMLETLATGKFEHKRLKELAAEIWLHTAIRAAELVRMKKVDIKPERLVVVLTKTKGKKAQEIAIDEATLARLQELAGMNPTPFVVAIQDETGQWVQPCVNWWTQAFKRVGRKLGTMVSPHRFRHTWATEALAAGENLKVVQEQLRHTNIMTTAKHYAHVTDPGRRAAIGRVAEVFKARRAERIRPALKIVGGGAQ